MVASYDDRAPRANPDGGICDDSPIAPHDLRTALLLRQASRPQVLHLLCQERCLPSDFDAVSNNPKTRYRRGSSETFFHTFRHSGLNTANNSSYGATPVPERHHPCWYLFAPRAGIIL